MSQVKISIIVISVALFDGEIIGEASRGVQGFVGLHNYSILKYRQDKY
jgi:hypothetical protein